MNDVSCGPAPCDERCAQAVDDDPTYYERSQEECQQYVKQLRRRFPNPPEGVRFKITREGDLRWADVVVLFGDGEDALNYALFVEANLPERWTDDAVLDWRTAGESQEL